MPLRLLSFFTTVPVSEFSRMKPTLLAGSVGGKLLLGVTLS